MLLCFGFIWVCSSHPESSLEKHVNTSGLRCPKINISTHPPSYRHPHAHTLHSSNPNPNTPAHTHFTTLASLDVWIWLVGAGCWSSGRLWFYTYTEMFFPDVTRWLCCFWNQTRFLTPVNRSGNMFKTDHSIYISCDDLSKHVLVLLGHLIY